MQIKKIILAGEIYSHNLGDGVIYECSRYLFQRTVPDVPIIPVDISGRLDWNPCPPPRFRGFLMNQFKKAFPGLYGWLAERSLYYRFKRRIQPRLEPILEPGTILVFAGGKVLMDNSLEFPVKLHLISTAALAKGVPIHFLGCGAGSRWSKRALFLIKPILNAAVSISLRDEESQKAIQTISPATRSHVSFDPAIWAAAVYPPLEPKREDQVIGLNLINSFDANSNRDAARRISQHNMILLWRQMVEILVQKGYRVNIFTNGYCGDEVTLETLRRSFGSHVPDGVFFQPPPVTPTELAAIIAPLSGLIHCRLHAGVIASAYAIPSVGLDWEVKIGAFYQQTNRAGCSFQLKGGNPQEIIDRLLDEITNRKLKRGVEEWKRQVKENVLSIQDAPL